MTASCLAIASGVDTRTAAYGWHRRSGDSAAPPSARGAAGCLVLSWRPRGRPVKLPALTFRTEGTKGPCVRDRRLVCQSLRESADLESAQARTRHPTAPRLVGGRRLPRSVAGPRRAPTHDPDTRPAAETGPCLSRKMQASWAKCLNWRRGSVTGARRGTATERGSRRSPVSMSSDLLAHGRQRLQRRLERAPRHWLPMHRRQRRHLELHPFDLIGEHAHGGQLRGPRRLVRVEESASNAMRSAGRYAISMPSTCRSGCT